MTRENSTSRHAYIDFLRVISILLVILLHCIGEYLFDPENIDRPLWVGTAYLNELCRVGVPLFFMMSGFLLLDKKIEKSASSTVIVFLKLPYRFCCMIFFITFFCRREMRARLPAGQGSLSTAEARIICGLYILFSFYIFSFRLFAKFRRNAPIGNGFCSFFSASFKRRLSRFSIRFLQTRRTFIFPTTALSDISAI